jgi:hypothetical protein
MYLVSKNSIPKPLIRRMQTLPPIVLAATGLGILAASAALSVAVLASLRGGESRATARRLAPVTVTPALAAFVLGTAALNGTVPTVAPFLGVLGTSALLAPALRSLWRTRPETSAERSSHGYAAD